MTALLTIFFLCLLASALIIFRYVRLSGHQERSFDVRLRQSLIDHKPQLPRQVVRCFHGPDVPVPTIFSKGGCK